MTKKPFPVSRKEERTQAEAKAMEYIKQKHARLERIFLSTVYREEDAWILHGEVKFKRAYFFTVEKTFKIQVNPETATVKSYEENVLSRHKLK
ncbi:MAG: hypothetical protein CW716_08790 [Candidatus Bathyarchaeum sp.]|nr:MAG: hypothetical protein CW716_08790 [Candidatus Bathyarchaeum sp.]